MLKFQDLQRLGRSSYKDLKLLWDRLYFPIWIFFIYIKNFNLISILLFKNFNGKLILLVR
jgi:hypothetical protein